MTIYKLRRCNKNCGIMSNAWVFTGYTISNLLNGNLSIIDMQSDIYKQCNTRYEIGKINIWERYFNQPFNLSLSDIQNGVDMVVDGITPYSTITPEKINNITKKILSPAKRINRLLEQYHIDYDHTIGVLLRGTDYRAIHPQGEYIQPDIKTVKEDCKKIIDCYDIKTIFIATDQKSFIDELSDLNINVIVIQKTFVSDFYNKNTYNHNILSNLDFETKDQINTEYVTSVVALSKMKYNLLSSTSATQIYKLLRLNEYTPSYEKIYNFGKY